MFGLKVDSEVFLQLNKMHLISFEWFFRVYEKYKKIV